MMLPLVLLRPQPGNDQSAMRARALGLDVVQLPLFEIIAAEPAPMPTGPFDAVLVTSANGARFGAAFLAGLADLPIYAVGEATAQAIRTLGHEHVIVGGGDAASTIPLIGAAGHRTVLHMSGTEVRAFDAPGLSITRHIIYQSAERADVDIRPMLERFERAVLAVHSPRAGERISALIPTERRSAFRLVAISQAAASASGDGWASISVSTHPDDTALLTLAESLCNCGD
jgi:uroporphyrinogen-III synthase